MSKLFQPIRVGTFELAQRIAMAPLTRYRADSDHVHTDIGVTYYSQRASAPGTLLITEATFISPKASGYANVPGIWNSAQVAAWRKITDEVHAKGSRIFMQLWNLGRAAIEDNLKAKGFDVVSASDIPMEEGAVKPRALTIQEIEAFLKEYKVAARNAIEAGFDGVEVHGANGYLVDQFIQDVSNKRTDRYGGSIENRSRFALEVVKAISEEIGAERTAIRLSPWNNFQGMKMKDPKPQFTHLIKALKEYNLAYLHFVVSRNPDEDIEFALEAWNNHTPAIVSSGFDNENSRKALDEDYAKYDTLIAYGRHFIANPDLVFRLKNNLELNPYDRFTFYTPQDPHGYIDYPFYSEAEPKAVEGKVVQSEKDAVGTKNEVVGSDEPHVLTKVVSRPALEVSA